MTMMRIIKLTRVGDRATLTSSKRLKSQHRLIVYYKPRDALVYVNQDYAVNTA